MGIVGAVIILRWSYGLVISAGKTLLDIVPDDGLADRIRSRLEIKGDRVADLHLWRLGPGHAGMIASVIIRQSARALTFYNARLGRIEASHVTIEVHRCPDPVANQRDCRFIWEGRCTGVRSARLRH